MVYNLIKFHVQSISQTGSMAGMGAILPHPWRIQEPKNPGEIGLIVILKEHIDIRPLTLKAKIKEKTVLQNHYISDAYGAAFYC